MDNITHKLPHAENNLPHIQKWTTVGSNYAITWNMYAIRDFVKPRRNNAERTTY